jgi:hypothetical protein
MQTTRMQRSFGPWTADPDNGSDEKPPKEAGRGGKEPEQKEE